MTKEESEWLVSHPQVKRLTFCGHNDLYQTPQGAHTIADAMFLEQLTAKCRARLAKNKRFEVYHLIPISPEFELRDEQCSDKYGCSSVLF